MKSAKKKTAEAEITAATKKSNKNLYAALGLLVILALIGGGYYFYKNRTIEFKDVPVGNAQSPTEAYKMLFAAVKSKDAEKIKKMMSENSIGFAGFVSGQQSKPVEEVIANGFTATTFSPTLPQMRDERIKDNFGALEVLNPQTKQWEDLPFVREESGWKLAIGDMFKGTYEKPGIGKAVREQEAANAVNNNMTEVKPNANANTNGVNVITPTNVNAINKNLPQIIKPTNSNVKK